MTRTVSLIAEIRNGESVLEKVLVEEVAENRYRLLRSPGLVPGLAAGDEFELADNESHGYRLLKHGGNVCVQMFFPHHSEICRQVLEPLIAEISGTLDGELNLNERSTLVFTIPVTSGFPAIEAVMEQAQTLSPDCEWYYGNVYDAEDGVTPLNWWKDFIEK